MSDPVVLLDGDLLARGRVADAARSRGLEVRPVDSDRGADALIAMAPCLVVVDLDRGRERALETVGAARAAGLAAPVVGFYSHVDTALGAAAEAAGVKTFRRGRFWNDLPELLPEG